MHENYEVETERSVVCSLLLGGTQSQDIIDLIDEEMFYAYLTKEVVKAAKVAQKEGLQIEMCSLIDVLRRQDKLDKCGGISELSKLLDASALVDIKSAITCLTMSMVRRKIASKTKEISLLGEHSRTTNKEFVDYAIKDMSEFSDEVGKIVAPAMAFASVDDLIVESAPPDIACEVLRITAGRPCIIAGQGSSGKTWLAQELLLSTLLGKRLFGGRYRPAQRVVNLDYEMTKQPLMRRYKALLPKHDDEESICYLTDKKLMEAAFLVSSIPDEKPMMNDSKFCSILDKCLQGATICVIDSLRASLPGIDENDSRIGQYINALAKVSSNTGCAIVLLHHAAKSKEGGINIRGSSAIRDACGSVWTIDSKSRTDKIMNLSKPPADIPAYDFEIKWRFERFESTPTGIYQDVRLELVK